MDNDTLKQPELGLRWKSKRQGLYLSQDQLAGIAAVRQATLSGWEDGTGNPRKSSIEWMEDTFKRIEDSREEFLRYTLDGERAGHPWALSFVPWRVREVWVLNEMNARGMMDRL